MGSEGRESQQNEASLDSIVRTAEDSLNYLKTKRSGEVKLDGVIVGIVVFVGTLFVLGISSVFIFGNPIFSSTGGLFGSAAVLSLVAGVTTYFLMKRRAFKFAQLGELIAKVKAGPVTAEDGLRLMDAMQQARLAVKKGKMDSAFSNGVAAFIIVGILSLSAGFGFVAGVMVYLYFRYEALREYEKEDERYQESRKELLQSM